MFYCSDKCFWKADAAFYWLRLSSRTCGAFTPRTATQPNASLRGNRFTRVYRCLVTTPINIEIEIIQNYFLKIYFNPAFSLSFPIAA